jgi:AAA+ ATPase superfamily predicted ATPase
MSIIYEDVINELTKSLESTQPSGILLFGPQNVGKTALVTQLGFDVVDCVQIGTLA